MSRYGDIELAKRRALEVGKSDPAPFRAIVPPDLMKAIVQLTLEQMKPEMSTVDNYLRSGAAGFAGLGGDLANMYSQGMGGPSQDVVPDTEDVGEVLGADLDSPSGVLGQLGFPDWGDAAVFLGKAVMAGKGFNMALPLFHGTPHKFDMFDMSKIGTGEGVQAYGHGMYFAENPGVAHSYAMKLAGGKTLPRKWTGDGWSKVKGEFGLSEDQATQVFDIAEAAINDMGDDAFSAVIGQNTPYSRALDEISMNRAVRGEPHVYEVDYPDELFEKMLDWDKPLSQQPDNVKKAITEILDERGHEVAGAMDATGTHSYKSLSASDDGAEFHNRLEEILRQSREPEYSKRTSEILREHGIPGIKYYDAASRGKGKGTRNIVVFDPDDIREVKRDGEVVYRNITK